MLVQRSSAPAVTLEQVRVSHGFGRNAVEVIHGIDLCVPRGKIFGLLGPSGCGKTTLLRTVVGRLIPNFGTVKLFGKDPGCLETGIPGAGVGFMPQELTLFPEFTIEETLVFFGRLGRLNEFDIRKRIDFLVEFLDLPDRRRNVKNLSGGQQRRVSLAAALIHRPPLLILDEPTVGVDPLLRTSIWKHLVDLAREEGLTIIITTHYIEEARQADLIGLMRRGRILAQDSPGSLMERYNKNSLEDVFLTLCMADKKGNSASTLNISAMLNADQTVPPITYQAKFPKIDIFVNDKPHAQKELPNVRPLKDSLNRIKTLFKKNSIRITRNIPFQIFNFFIPSIQLILFCICIGADPVNLPIAVVNNDAQPILSNKLLMHINNKTIFKSHSETREEALQKVHSAKAFGLIEFPSNFTQALQRRYILGIDADAKTINDSSIRVKLDMTNQHIGFIVQKALYEAFLKFAGSILESMHKDVVALQPPILIEKPVYGKAEPNFTDFMAPGVMLSIIYILSAGITALTVLVERREGTIERTMVQGVKPWEILISHVLTLSLMLIGQVTTLLIFSTFIFNIPIHGSFINAWVLSLLQGFAGMGFGLLIAILCPDEVAAVMICIAVFYPNVLLSGVLWPLHSMMDILRYFSYGLPQTIPIESLRCIMYRGWGLSYFEVYFGFFVSIFWFIFFLGFSVWAFNAKS